MEIHEIPDENLIVEAAKKAICDLYEAFLKYHPGTAIEVSRFLTQFKEEAIALSDRITSLSPGGEILGLEDPGNSLVNFIGNIECIESGLKTLGACSKSPNAANFASFFS